MKTLLKAGLVLALLFGACFETLANWGTNLRAAVAQARQQDKLVYVFFTGSDWCPPCKRMKREILSSAEFHHFARANLVLVEIDSPRRRPQSEALKKANQALKEKYGVSGLPTVIVFSTDGTELLRQTGFPGGTPRTYVERLRKLRAEQKSQS